MHGPAVVRSGQGNSPSLRGIMAMLVPLYYTILSFFLLFVLAILLILMGEVPVMEEEKTRREASVLRYKEKRQTRLFSKKIRYEVRKLNADKRPRLKGRFVKRVPAEKIHAIK
ncbi:hypothetical protein RJ639_015112 [Escallonia herrerae]|uniref:CCT domain-containing protein n=1 Tax=Escallonia herrerae TaxID=1293975 RepID=A0AA89ANM6_9ASTE|nr:hypothetical protein RJ639_015112 [Escallonia herrerae]